MRTKTLIHTFLIAFLIFVAACSTKKDTFLARNSHALSTRDNILYKKAEDNLTIIAHLLYGNKQQIDAMKHNVGED